MDHSGWVHYFPVLESSVRVLSPSKPSSTFQACPVVSHSFLLDADCVLQLDLVPAVKPNPVCKTRLTQGQFPLSACIISTCGTIMAFALLAVCFVAVAILYLYHVNRSMLELPEEARRLSPNRWTVDEIKAAYKKAIEDPIDVSKSLPPKQDRRYIIVGGSGMVPDRPTRFMCSLSQDSLATGSCRIFSCAEKTQRRSASWTCLNQIAKPWIVVWPMSRPISPMKLPCQAPSISNGR